MTHICVSKIIVIGSDNGLSPGRRQAIIWTNDGILLTGPLRRNFSEIWIQINTCSFTKMHLKMSSGKCRPYCFSLNVLIQHVTLICFKHSSLPLRILLLLSLSIALTSSLSKPPLQLWHVWLITSHSFLCSCNWLSGLKHWYRFN